MILFFAFLGPGFEEHKASGKFITVKGCANFPPGLGRRRARFCIHGVPTSSYLYRKVLKELVKKGFKGVAIDLPGLGLSK